MTYATKQDMIESFGETELIQLTDRSGLVGSIVDSVLTRAQKEAQEIIDLNLEEKYSLPLEAPYPGLLTALEADIAWYRLQFTSPTDAATKRYDDAIAMLDRISKGEVNLPIDPVPGGEDTPGARDVAATEPLRIFNRADTRWG